MKAKRKIFDAVDMLTEESSAQTTEAAADGVKMLPVDKIRAFHDHPFHLYAGERLNDMVESIKEHGGLRRSSCRRSGADMKCFPVITGRTRRRSRGLKRYRLS